MNYREFEKYYESLGEDRQLTLIKAVKIIGKLKSETNDIFFPLYFDTHRYLVLMGGGGSGKSIFAGRKIIERVYREPGHTVLVLRKVARTLRESCFRQLVMQIGESFDIKRWNISKTDMTITAPNGSRIIFAGLDDAEKLKSVYGITMVWVEEASEITSGDFNQIDIRLRGESSHYRQMILTFNPISVSHWLKGRFFDRNDENAFVSKSTYLDNRFLDEDSKKVLESFRESDEYYYNVYCLGNWGVSGVSVFGGNAVNGRIENCPDAVKEGEFMYDGEVPLGSEFAEYDGGIIKIYEEPKEYLTYIASADTSGEGSDRNVCQVICADTGVQVAVLSLQSEEDRFVYQCVSLARYYNGAVLCFECNFSTYPVREALRLGYENQYIRRSEDSISRSVIPSYGFRTTSVTRPLIISTLMRIFRESPHLFNDRDTLYEMLSFIRTPSGRIEADSGMHDDHVMALAIAYFIRDDVSLSEPPKVYRRKVNFAFERERTEGIEVV